MRKPLTTPWTPETLRKHALDIKLWEKARGAYTGPRTVDGKVRSALRGTTHGMRGAGAIALRAYLVSVLRLCKVLTG